MNMLYVDIVEDEGLGDVEMPDKSTRIEIPRLPSYIKKEKRKGENGFSQYNVCTPLLKYRSIQCKPAKYS